ncbi:MAG TPA: site-specific integrase [Thermodesulfobacteriota bacterium]|nr:site-specific integrase [Thermodesulfobacteriota bacterium]
MTLKEAITLFGYHQRSNLKPRTVRSYHPLLQRFEVEFGDRSFDSIGSDEIFQFLERVTGNRSKSTRRLRYAQLKALFNFLIDKCNLNMKNPCNTPLLSKAFKTPKQAARRILDREIVEELIYNTQTLRDRLILGLQARCGLRIGEALKIKVSDVVDRKLVLNEPKSGKELEVAFMPEQIAKRLHDYIQQEDLNPEDRIFPICYSTARSLIKNLGGRLKVVLTPHDLRRYSATYASRNGVPLEIVSKVILQHQDLKTTRAYLGRVTESEAIRWMVDFSLEIEILTFFSQ